MEKLNYQELTIKICNENHINEILELQDVIINELSDKEILRKNDREMFLECMKDRGLTLGVWHKDILVAVGIFVDFVGTDEDLSVCVKNYSVRNCANFKLILVRKEYRGNCLQKSLMWLLEKNARNRGYEYLCCTVSPKNKHSIKNVIEMGYVYDVNIKKYGGLERALYIKNIEESVSKYNKLILRVVSEIEGKEEPNDLILEGIELSRCFNGELSLATTGDVLEYIECSSGNIFYGLLINRFTPMVIIYNPYECKLELREFSTNLSNMKLNKILINTIGGK